LSRIFLQTTKVIGSETELLLNTTNKSRTIDHFSKKIKVYKKIEFWAKMEYLFLIYLSKFRWKIVILVENQTLIKKIEILGKHRNFNKNGFPWKNRILIKIEILTKSHLVSDFGVKIKL